MGIAIQPPGPAAAPVPAASLVNYGQVTAPGALTFIANIPTPAPGTYALNIYAQLSGTPGAADRDNIQLDIDNTAITTLPLAAGITAEDIQPVMQLVVKTIGTNIVVRSIGAGAAGSIYTCLIVATKVL